MRRRLKQPSALAYANTVVRILSEDFPGLNDETTRTIVRDAIERHVLNPTDMLEVIVDDPMSANWRVKADRHDLRRVRLAHTPLNPKRLGDERERRINTALASIQMEA